MAEQRLLCAACVGYLSLPTVYVAVISDPGKPNRLDMEVMPGPGLVVAARTAVDAGKRLLLNQVPDVGIYADTMVRGTASCAAHVYAVGNARPERVPW